MSLHTEVTFKFDESFITSESVFNRTLDNFAYSTVGLTELERYGAIAFFQYINKWESPESAIQETHVIANIRMPEDRLVELAKLILEQYEAAKATRENK
ncbi:hypothetical protein [Providencia sp. PROV128]|uniref:hypothetical protein n=1 Tax=Providencia sp. PROV128 TaxID=2949838 RepID=UPI00234AEBCF